MSSFGLTRSPPFVPTVKGGAGMSPARPPSDVPPPEAADEDESVTNAQLLRMMQRMSLAQERSDSRQQDLQDQFSEFRQHLEERDNGEPSLRDVLDFRHFPPAASDSRFSPRELMKLPQDPRAMPVQLLDSRGHELVVANKGRIKAEIPSKDDKNFAARRDGQHIQLAHELKALLSVESIGLMEEAMFTKLHETHSNGELSHAALWAAVSESLGYLSAWRGSIVKVRVAEIAALLQFNDSTAREWAGLHYGPQNTLMGDDPAALAFAQAKAVEPKPELRQPQSQASHQQQQSRTKSAQQQQGGRGSQGKSGVRFATAGQVKGGAAEAAAAKGQ